MIFFAEQVAYPLDSNQSRIQGVIGSTWSIPDDAPKPNDARIKSGKYIKTKNLEMD